MSKREHKLEVIGAGYGRTGTSSLKQALEILGYGRCYHMKEVFKNENHTDFWYRVAKKEPYDFDEVFNVGEVPYGASCDFPSSQYWKEQLERYPDAKVVLTVREPEKWYKSCKETIFLSIPGTPYSLFGLRVLRWFGLRSRGFERMVKEVVSKGWDYDFSKEHLIRCFNEHIERVKRECPPDKLLVFNVAEGWEPLCKFLGKPVPAEPFPNVNDTKEFQNQLQVPNRMGWALFCMMSVAAGGALWCALHSYGVRVSLPKLEL